MPTRDVRAATPLRYHHCRPLRFVKHEVVRPVLRSRLVPKPRQGAGRRDGSWRAELDDFLYWEAAYRWLARRTGF